jgi:hypothetical protein
MHTQILEIESRLSLEKDKTIRYQKPPDMNSLCRAMVGMKAFKGLSCCGEIIRDGKCRTVGSFRAPYNHYRFLEGHFSENTNVVPLRDAGFLIYCCY